MLKRVKYADCFEITTFYLTSYSWSNINVCKLGVVFFKIIFLIIVMGIKFVDQY